MNKKVISSVLAGVMALSTLGVSASAADKAIKAAGATTYKVSATLAAPEINVTLPGSVAAVVNPYGVSFEMKGETYGAQGVTSPIYTIKNNTTASAISVTATATLTVPTTSSKDSDGATVKTPTIKVAAAEGDIATAETAKEKTIYACVKGAAPTSAVTADKLPGYVDPDTKKAVADLILFHANDSQTEAANAVTIPFVDATLSTKEDPITGTPTTLMIIPKATKEVLDTDGKTVKTAAKIGYGQFQLGGDVTDAKITPWTSADKIAINLVLDIGPSVDPETT
ncbi:MAG: hypothetical protein K2H23_03695 [Oscillospiraceae bacterium]|nr:hypothetical protein [Oscillospiraceae bacterium]